MVSVWPMEDSGLFDILNTSLEILRWKSTGQYSSDKGLLKGFKPQESIMSSSVTYYMIIHIMGAVAVLHRIEQNTL